MTSSDLITIKLNNNHTKIYNLQTRRDQNMHSKFKKEKTIGMRNYICAEFNFRAK